MNHINEFECADARDKLYGILNLVGWSSGFTPTPDYQKSTYDVAVDAVGSLKSTPLGRGALSWAQHIATIFEISPMDVAIQDRLRMRRNNAHSSQSCIPSSGHSQLSGSFWEGVPILAHIDEPQSRSRKRLYCAASKTQDGTIELVDVNDTPCVLAPPQTTTGDWVLWMKWAEPKEWDSTGMIVRYSGPSLFTIIGLARRTREYTEIAYEHFSLLWDPEDLLLLHLAAMEPDKMDIEELHSYQVCGAKNSSYAVHLGRPQSPIKICIAKDARLPFDESLSRECGREEIVLSTESGSSHTFPSSLSTNTFSLRRSLGLEAFGDFSPHTSGRTSIVFENSQVRDHHQAFDKSKSDRKRTTRVTIQGMTLLSSSSQCV